MFRVELYRWIRCIEVMNVQTEFEAFRAVDALLTAIHKGDHGHGDFRVSADRINDIGLFQESLFDSKFIQLPLQRRVA